MADSKLDETADQHAERRIDPTVDRKATHVKTMTFPRQITRPLIALLGLCSILSACDAGPKTYDDCMLLASRNSDNDRQFRIMAQSCKDRFGHTLPLRAPPTDDSKPGTSKPVEPPSKQR